MGSAISADSAAAKSTPTTTPGAIPVAGAKPLATATPSTRSNKRGPNPQSVAAVHAGRTPTQWGLEVDGVITRFKTNKHQIALTFDACGSGAKGSQVDQELVSFLVSNNVPATLFLNSRWINANPAVTQQLLGNPLFCIGNHGTAHLPLSVNGRSAYGLPGTASARQAADEVWGNHETLRGLTGRAPQYFRSGTAHYDEVAVRIVQDLGEKVIGFTINGDAGATASAATIEGSMRNARQGSIALAHMNHPEGSTFEGFRTSIAALRRRGVEFVRLSDVDNQLV